MRVLVATDFNITVCAGRYYFTSAMASIAQRYFDFFGCLDFCTRVTWVEKVSKTDIDVTPMVNSIVEISSLEGAMLHFFDNSIENAIKNCDLAITRCPSIIAYRVSDIARKLKKPYLAEAMGCAWDAYRNHGITGKAVAPYMFYKMKQVVWKADFASYVTERFLQQRYPRRGESLSASNVYIDELTDTILEKRLRKISMMNPNSITLMTAAAVDVRYKGQQYVIQAIPALNRKGIRVRYILAGKGDSSHLRSVAEKAGVADQVVFTGALSHEEVLNKMDDCDIYIQPSLQEGLPRAVIEAMSRGCPCLGAKTAGIPELIPDECVFERKSSAIIVSVIIRLMNSNFHQYAERNFVKSKEYENAKLYNKRRDYFELIARNISESRK